MSSAARDINSMSTCAACGKGGDHLKACTACHLVKYCNRECQISHRPKHKKECRKRAAELKHTGDDNISNCNVNEISEGISNVGISGSVSGSTDKKTSISYEQNNYGGSIIISDDELFQDPPPKEDCPICMLPIPYALGMCGVGASYQACCGKILCGGCGMASAIEMNEGNIKDCCAFCRVSIEESDKEYLKRLKVRMSLNDAMAFLDIGMQYRDGSMGLPQDMNRAIELLSKAAELGSIGAHTCLATVYRTGRGVEQNIEKAVHHYKLAAQGICLGA